MGEQRDERGFTLLEVALALGLLCCVMVALVDVVLQAGRSSSTARRTALASLLAAEKLEQLRGLAWGYDEGGRQVQDLQSDVSQRSVADSGGIGISLSPFATLSQDVPGFVDYHDGSGRWIGNANGSPQGAAFARRWSVSLLEDAPGATLVLQVSVVALPPAPSGGSRQWELARLATLKTRRPQ